MGESVLTFVHYPKLVFWGVPNFLKQASFQVSFPKKSDKVINTFNLRSQTHLPKISEDEYEKVLKWWFKSMIPNNS